MLRALCLLVIFLAALSPEYTTAELSYRCGTLPLVSQNQAICAATYYLQVKSEACPGKAGFSFSAQATGASWVVQSVPNDWKSRLQCTGDRLEIAQQTGQLIKWERFGYQPQEGEKTGNVQRFR